MYGQLLRQYLESQEGETQGEHTFEQLTTSLDKLKELRETYDMSTVDLTDTEVNLLHYHFGDLSIETTTCCVDANCC